MTTYSSQYCLQLEKEYKQLKLLRPQKTSRYDVGKVLHYEISAVGNQYRIEADLLIEKFVGGGFAGQVYKVQVLSLAGDIEHFSELQEGNSYALKILIPPSRFSLFFRNFIYWLGFGGPFQPQFNPAAARAGAIWQKFIRLAAGKQFQREDCVVDIYGLFLDAEMGSCGEISEWVEGRTWWLEVNDHFRLFSRQGSGSPEFRAKYKFMKEFVQLLHQIGAPEFARQYEWSTMKSQPNCLKRESSSNSAESGLVAVDFRAGLALLPFLPMSPGDVKLIIKGILRGSLVQFDRGNLKKLHNYISNNFADSPELMELFHELEKNERFYRNSLPDLTHNHFRILFSKRLWTGIFRSTRNTLRIRQWIDRPRAMKLSRHKLLMIIFYIFSFIPILGSFLIKLWGMRQWRLHYRKLISSPGYVSQAWRGFRLQKLLNWLRKGRIIESTADRLKNSSFLFLLHFCLSILPGGLHRFLTEKEYFRHKLYMIFVRPLKLYFDQQLREEWLLDMVAEGKQKHMLSETDAEVIVEQLQEPFIQKYLKSLAVHVCTIPITQVVSVFLALLYVFTHPEMPRAQAWGIGLGIIALFQIIPISPGSLVRGLYVVFLVIKERNFKDYNIAVFLGFFKYIGYLAFPIQMTYRYPALARFMAGHWATEAVHIIPVFGEKGALLEHWIFDLFYNLPLTIRRQMSERIEIRKTLKPRLWHFPLILVLSNLLLYYIDSLYLASYNLLPGIKEIWWQVILISFLSGFLLSRWAGGLKFQSRILLFIISGILSASVYSMLSYYLGFEENILVEATWRLFIITLFSVIGGLISEITIGENK